MSLSRDGDMLQFVIRMGVFFAFLFRASACLSPDDAVPCPVNWTTRDYALRQLAPNAYEEYEAFPYYSGEFYISANTLFPLVIFGVFRKDDGARADWLASSEYSLNAIVSTSDGALQKQVSMPFTESSRINMRISISTPSESPFSITSASISAVGGGLIANGSVPLSVSGLLKFRVLPSVMSVISLLVCVGFGRDNLLGTASPPVRAVVGVPLLPIRLRAFTSQMKKFMLTNSSFTVTLQVPGAADEPIGGTVTTLIAGDVLLTNIRIRSAVGLATILINLPETLKSKTYPVHPFQFSVRVSVRVAGVASVDLHPSSDACWSASGVFSSSVSSLVFPQAQFIVSPALKLPSLVLSVVDGVSGTNPIDPLVASLRFYDVSSGLPVGRPWYALVSSGIAVFEVDVPSTFFRRAAIVGRTLVGVAEVSGLALVTGRLYVVSQALSQQHASRLEWDSENEQFYSSAVPMVATDGVVMPLIRVYTVGADGSLLASSPGTLTAACESEEGEGVVLPSRGGTAVFISERVGGSSAGFYVFDKLIFTRTWSKTSPGSTTPPYRCRLLLSLELPTGRSIALRSAFGALFQIATRGVALSFARHRLQSFTDHLTSVSQQPLTATVGEPLPELTLLVRNSDWSVDRTSSEGSTQEVIVDANVSGCPLSNVLGVANGGEVKFTSLTLHCAGGLRFIFYRRAGTGGDEATAIDQGRHLFTEVIASSLSRLGDPSHQGRTVRPVAMPVHALRLTVAGNGEVPLRARSAAGVSIRSAGSTFSSDEHNVIITVVALGRNGSPLILLSQDNTVGSLNDRCLRVRGEAVVSSRVEGEILSRVPIACSLDQPNGTCNIMLPMMSLPTAWGTVSVDLCAVCDGGVCGSGKLTSTIVSRHRVFETNRSHTGDGTARQSPLVLSASPFDVRSLSVSAPSLPLQYPLTATYFSPLSERRGGNASDSHSAIVADIDAVGGVSQWPQRTFSSMRIADPSTVTTDGSYALLVTAPKSSVSGATAGEDNTGVDTMYPSTLHLSPTRFVFPLPIADDVVVAVYVAERYKTFNAGRWVARLSAVLQIDADRVVISRVVDCFRVDVLLSCTLIELSFRAASTHSVVKKSASVARSELLGYTHTCDVAGAEKLRIFQVQPLGAVTPFCDAVALQELVDSSRLCENAAGRDQRCDCFITFAESMPPLCTGAPLYEAVCVHVSSCKDSRILNLCEPVRPDVALQVVQAVLITAAVIVIGLIAANYSFIIELATTRRRERLRKSRIVGPPQHHDEIFIAS